MLLHRLVLKMEPKVIILVLAVTLPKLAECFLFGVQLTNTAGDVFAGANPAQTAGILGLGALGSALGLVALDAVVNRPTPSPVRTVRRPVRYRYRGRRELNDKV